MAVVRHPYLHPLSGTGTHIPTEQRPLQRPGWTRTPSSGTDMETEGHPKHLPPPGSPSRKDSRCSRIGTSGAGPELNPKSVITETKAQR